jgi:hypothetical protein
MPIARHRPWSRLSSLAKTDASRVHLAAGPVPVSALVAVVVLALIAFPHAGEILRFRRYVENGKSSAVRAGRR